MLEERSLTKIKKLASKILNDLYQLEDLTNYDIKAIGQVTNIMQNLDIDEAFKNAHELNVPTDIEKPSVFVKKLWVEFADIPVVEGDNDDVIDEPWRIFSIGTEKLEIWHWFEETFDVSVAKDLMGITKEFNAFASWN